MAKNSNFTHIFGEAFDILLTNKKNMIVRGTSAWGDIANVIDFLIEVWKTPRDTDQFGFAIGKYRFLKNVDKGIEFYEITSEEGDSLASVEFRNDTYISSEINKVQESQLKEALMALKNTSFKELKISNEKLARRLDDFSKVTRLM